MVNLTINDTPVSVPAGTTIIAAAQAIGINIPSLCYLKDLNEISACRVCSVEVEGEAKLVPSCSNVVREGMKIHTNSPRARQARKINVELILSQHDCRCAICSRSGNCKLQKISNDLGIKGTLYADMQPKAPIITDWTTTFPLFRNPRKCLKCMRCVQVCEKVQSLGVWDVSGTGSRTTIDVSHNRVIKQADCVLCGQCITHCPVEALRERDDTDGVFAALAAKQKVTVIQVAPAVRTALGATLQTGETPVSPETIVAALKQIGFDYVFDTSFAADLTIMEESTELLQRLNAGELQEFPMFTSCCPAWVRFMKSQYPQYVKYLSSSKSPQQMFGAVTKTWFAQSIGVNPADIYSVSVMPCLAKKAECALPTMARNGVADVDASITTREIIRMIRSENILPQDLTAVPFDSPLGTATGAGVIFGATGGVMEAALRSAYYFVTGQAPKDELFQAVRGEKAWKEATYSLGQATVRCAVVSGLANARKLMEALIAKEVQYDFVEVMSCPGGCVGGGGQPISLQDEELATKRSETLYALDKKDALRNSYDNPVIQELYGQFLEKPGSEAAEHLLHTDHEGWSMPLAVKLQKKK
ncbi:MAG: [FeFe] hydrogenase, group A [Acidaminococcaceae bacterium]|nr:[FeFe] hydrogenase, group A [Acidaminococcaceae bacterium]